MLLRLCSQIGLKKYFWPTSKHTSEVDEAGPQVALLVLQRCRKKTLDADVQCQVQFVRMQQHVCEEPPQLLAVVRVVH